MKDDLMKEYVSDEKFLLNQENAIISDLVKIRDLKGVSQKRLSEMVAMSQPSLARLESKKISPGINTMIKLLAPMGYTLAVVPISDLK